MTMKTDTLQAAIDAKAAYAAHEARRAARQGNTLHSGSNWAKIDKDIANIACDRATRIGLDAMLATPGISIKDVMYTMRDIVANEVGRVKEQKVKEELVAQLMGMQAQLEEVLSHVE